MERAAALSVDYLLILGQKEAIDNTVTIRNVSSHAQDTIPLARLTDYLKHITLVTVLTIASYTIVC
jgi:histidyl-tRNA synthetase